MLGSICFRFIAGDVAPPWVTVKVSGECEDEAAPCVGAPCWERVGGEVDGLR